VIRSVLQTGMLVRRRVFQSGRWISQHAKSKSQITRDYSDRQGTILIFAGREMEFDDFRGALGEGLVTPLLGCFE
jgi:hypothetical protein